jgi:hypothetical protein
MPSYEAVFRTFSIAVPDIELSGNAAQDARAVIDAIRAGHVYSTIDAIGGRAAMTFTATSGSARAVAGDELPVSGPVMLRVEVQAPEDATIAIKKDGRTIASGQGAKLEYGAGTEAGVYRVEVGLPDAPGTPPVPWIVSNPIYVGGQRTVATLADPHRAATALSPQYENGAAPAWSIETSPDSAGAIDVVPSASGGTELSLRYALSGTVSMAPYVAFVMPAGRALASQDRIMFTARANGPTRLSVQLRAPVGELGERWHRSVYLDTKPKLVTVYFDDLTPRGPTRQPKPILSDVQSVMFVIDTVNTSVGTSGQLWIDDVEYGR